MTKEQFITIGLTEEQAAKAAAESANELKEYIPKHRFEEVNSENKSLKVSIKENETALESLKNVTGNTEELQTQLKQLQTEAKERDTQHAEELKELKLTNAIKTAIAGKTHDESLLAGLFDRTKLILGDDGKITGLEEQLKEIRESKAFLFKEEKEPEKAAFTKVGSMPPARQIGKERMSMKDAIAAKIQAQGPQAAATTQ